MAGGQPPQDAPNDATDHICFSWKPHSAAETIPPIKPRQELMDVPIIISGQGNLADTYGAKYRILTFCPTEKKRGAFTMNEEEVKNTYPNMYLLICGYFNLDYDVIFGESDEDVIKVYARDEKIENISSCISEINKFMIRATHLGLRNKDFDHIFFQGYYYELHYGDFSCWLRHLCCLLEKYTPRTC